MSDDVVQQLMDSIIVPGAVASGAVLTKMFQSYIERVRSKKLYYNLNAWGKIHDLLEDTVHNTSVKRALIFEAHNSGKDIKPGSKLFISCLDEYVLQPFKGIKSIYQNYPVDVSYVKMLRNIMDNEVYGVFVKTMNNELLKNIYESQDVKYSLVIYIHHKKGSQIWYASFSTDKEIDSYDKLEVAYIKRNVEEIKKIIRTSHGR